MHAARAWWSIACITRRDPTIRRELLPLVRQALGDRYTIEREIGRGGAARVFLARDAEGRALALKILHPELLVSVHADRFLREIRLVSKTDHPLIAKVLDSGERDWLVYYVMPYVEGPTLRSHLDRAHQLPIPEAIQLGQDLLDALGHAHGHGIVHRDVKPDNIVLSSQGAVLLDFGIARAVAASGTDHLTRSGIAVGTSAYMSPEQISASQDIDYRSDIYSLGCVLFECIAGRPPFLSRNEAVVLQMHLNEPAPEVRTYRQELSPALSGTIARALQKLPSARWQSAAEMRKALLS